MLTIASTSTCSNHAKTAGTNNDQRSALTPAAIPSADVSAISGGPIDMECMEKTHNSAKDSENFIPENQFLVLHSHISRKFRYMRVLSRFGAYSVNKRDGIGTYSVKITASKAGYTSASVTTTFAVTR